MTTQGLEEESASKLSALRETVSGLARSCELPMSVCFNAVREEAYVGGGEEYLTFREAIQKHKTYFGEFLGNDFLDNFGSF